MSEQTLNSFSKGMIKDVADTLRPEDSYEDAQDMKLNATGNSSEYILSNVAGNDLLFTVPDIPSRLTIVYNENNNWVATEDQPYGDPFYITLDNWEIYYSQIGMSGITIDPDNYFDQLENILLTDPNFASLNLNVSRQGLSITIWIDDGTSVGVHGLTSLGGYNIFTTSLSIAQPNQQIIGWESINDDIYLLTTNDTSPTGGYGAIFKTNYDKIFFNTTIKLIYCNELNFTTQYPIANPGGIEAVYETPTIQRIYWTDRLNNLRAANVADKNLMAAPVSSLDVITSITLKKPQANVVTGGSLDVGHYQITYGLKTTSGVTTSFAHSTNSLYVGAEPLNSDYSDYMGADIDTISANGIEITFENLPPGFDELEIIVLKKTLNNEDPEIYKIATIPVTNSIISYLYTGNEPRVIINELQFIAVSNLFNKCHAIAQKDNILFAANTEGKNKVLEFDARAYRFDINGDVLLENSSSNQISATPNSLLNIPFYLDINSDAINPDQNVYKYQADGETLGGEGPNISYKFTQKTMQCDDRSGSYNVQGGDNLTPYNWALHPYRKNGGQEGSQGDFKDPQQDRDFRGYRRDEVYRFAFVPVVNNSEMFALWIADIKMPAIYEDYERYKNRWSDSFVYQDFDQAPYSPYIPGNTFPNPEPYRRPSVLDDYINLADENKIFPLCTLDKNNSGIAYVRSLGVEFTVNLPNDVAEKIDGFRIKRVKLDPDERTIVAQGAVFLTHKEQGSSGQQFEMEEWFSNIFGEPVGTQLRSWEYCLAGPETSDPVGEFNAGDWTATSNTTEIISDPSQFNDNSNFTWISPSTFGGDAATSIAAVSFQSPDFLFGTLPAYRGGDKLKLIGGASVTNSTTGSDQEVNPNEGQGFGKPADKTVFHKLYGGAPIAEGNNAREYEIKDAANVNIGEEIIIGNYPFSNRTTNASGFGGVPSVLSQGAYTTMIALNTGLPRTERSGDSFPIPFTADGQLDGYTYNPFIPGVDINGEWLELPTEITTGTTFNRPDKFMANYIRDIPGQYGGKGHAARQQNQYINTGAEVILEDGQSSYNVKVFGGDTFVNIFDTFKHLKNQNSETFDDDDVGLFRIGIGFYIPTESYVNTDMRHGYTINGTQSPSGLIGAQNNVADAELYPLDHGEDWKYNFAYSAEMDTQKSFPKRDIQPDETIHPVRIWASNVKTYGETVDSWRNWDYDKYIDITGHFGEIRQLVAHSDKLYAWQEKGFGIASVNERSVTTDNAGEGIVLGKSGVLPRFDYISEIIGSWHQFGFAISSMGILFFDSKNSSLYIYGSQGLNDISEGKINSWLYENTRGEILNNDPIINDRGGISSTYDYINKEYLITIYNSKEYINKIGQYILEKNSFTLAYNDVYNVFTSYRSFKPNMYINDNKNVMSLEITSTSSEVYIHEKGEKGVFYGNDPSESSVTITVNKEPYVTKIFDNIKWFTEVFDKDGNELSAETFSEAEIYNTYQTTGIRTVFKRLMREWKHAIIYAENTKNRIRSHYVKQKFKFLNNNDKEFRLHYIMNLFRRILK